MFPLSDRPGPPVRSLSGFALIRSPCLTPYSTDAASFCPDSA